MNDLGANVTVRLAGPGDAIALRRLAQLDSTLYEGGACLVADVGDELIAALPLDGVQGFGDPFRRTAGVLAILELRRAQLAGEGAPQGLNSARRAARRLRRYRAPVSA